MFQCELCELSVFFLTLLNGFFPLPSVCLSRCSSGIDHSEDSDEDVLISLTSNHRSSARKRTRTSTAATTSGVEDDGELPDTAEACLELLKPGGVKLGNIWCRYCGCRA